MEIELFEIRDHLSRHRPFSHLPPAMLDDLVAHIEVAYFRADSIILELGQDNHFLYFIRSGALEVTRSSGELYNRFGEGYCFGQFALMRSKRANLIQRWFGERDSPSLRLDATRSRYGLPSYHPHHALTDALVTAELLQAQLQDCYTPQTPVCQLWL